MTSDRRAISDADATPTSDALAILDGASALDAFPTADSSVPVDAKTPADGSLSDTGQWLSAEASVTDGPSVCGPVRTLSPAQSLAYAPMAVGDRWTYLRRMRMIGAADYTTLSPQRLEVTGTKTADGVPAFVFTEAASVATPSMEEYFVVNDTGLVNHGSVPAAIGLGSTSAPYVEVAFPVQVCSAFEQFRTPTSTGAIVSTSVMRSLAPTTVAGVSFPEALRVERSVTSTERAVDGGTEVVNPLTSTIDWYAPGIGRVKRSTETFGNEYVSEIMGAMVGGVGHGALPSENIGLVDVLSAFLGSSDRPAVASDGQNFLVVSSTSKSLDEGGMAAMLVGRDGRLIKSTAIVSGGRVPFSPAVAYGDGRYLVAYGTYNSTIKAVLLSSDGTQLGPAFDIWGSGAVAVAFGRGVFLVADNHTASLGITIVSSQGVVLGEVIPYPGQRQGSPALAFDGHNFLMAWLNRISDVPTDRTSHVSAARQNADGNAIDLEVTQVTDAPPSQVDVDVTFDGSRYVVSWFHQTSPSFIGTGDIRIARIGVDGVLLDPGGRLVAPLRNDTSKLNPRIARWGAQSVVVWEHINYRTSGPSTWIAGTRIDADGNSLDSSAADDGLFLSADRSGTSNQPTLPAVVWGGDRGLLVFVDRAAESVTMKRKLDGAVIYPW